MSADQQELFSTPVDKPRQMRTSAGPACHRRYLSGGDYLICGHPRSQHHRVGDCLYVLADDGRVLRTLACSKSHCAKCGCPEFQARDFSNPFLQRSDEPRRVTSWTMCRTCRHAKRDHHRSGCGCGCKRFVSPFAQAEETQQSELFPPAKTKTE
jgi:hypothetical protein